MDASSLINLITWDDATTFEPVFTLNMTDDQMHGYESVPMAVPDIPVHGQSMERYVRIIRLLDVCYLIYIFSGVLRRSQQLQSLYMAMRGEMVSSGLDWGIENLLVEFSDPRKIMPRLLKSDMLHISVI